jgi:hypothetical protein
MLHFLPTRAQWRRWSLPSKLTCIGAYAGVLSIALFFLWPVHLTNSVRPAKAGSVSIQGAVRAGDGNQAPGGDTTITAGDGLNGISGGDVIIGPGDYRAGDGGLNGRGGNLSIKAGDAKFARPTMTPNNALQPTADPAP